MANNKKRDTALVLLALLLLPAYYLIAHRMSPPPAPELRDALADTGRGNPVSVVKKRKPSHQVPGVPGIPEDSDMRDAVRNNAADGDGNGPGGIQQPPSFNHDSMPGRQPNNNYTPGTSVLPTREAQESEEVSPSAP